MMVNKDGIWIEKDKKIAQLIFRHDGFGPPFVHFLKSEICIPFPNGVETTKKSDCLENWASYQSDEVKNRKNLKIRKGFQAGMALILHDKVF